jgi:porin
MALQKMKTVIFIFISSFSISILRISAQNDPPEKKSPLTLEASYIGDVVRNFSGGIKKGTDYLGLANFRLSFDTKAAHLWKGGQLFINAANAHGGDPSATLVGDFHTVSNIEADEITYIHEFWYKQTINHFEIIAGLQDLNTDFVSSEYGSIFINSTFGTPSTIADNVPSPIFPLTTVGLALKWHVSETGTWKIAAFDGLPTELSRNSHNLNWKLDKDDGIFAVTEYQVAPITRNGLKGSYRAGIYYHSQVVLNSEENNKTKLFNYNTGLYIIADQMIYQKPGSKGGLGVFAQLAISPKAINTHNRYFGLGLSYQGLFNKRSNDKLGVAVTNAGFHDKIKNDETIIEICYKIQLTENLFIQPDLQYVIHPEGTDKVLKNATVGFIRSGINF